MMCLTKRELTHKEQGRSINERRMMMIDRLARFGLIDVRNAVRPETKSDEGLCSLGCMSCSNIMFKPCIYFTLSDFCWLCVYLMPSRAMNVNRGNRSSMCGSFFIRLTEDGSWSFSACMCGSCINKHCSSSSRKYCSKAIYAGPLVPCTLNAMRFSLMIPGCACSILAWIQTRHPVVEFLTLSQHSLQTW